ncbi:hypothetical protein RO3G_17144 [Rhizopus delemar RA 99-880]|uniref:Uncharacterized protein n=1 Tax=Rhizopus delemar (strain RA 99-880 / ATCC MYA-4621 / FGSC 9543 / NRRL 43880) TaxID=246409 RepID=I1CVR6_RHIO9|nr:hypothetical protein RO3G_17144 [Rhizopus delemar RA 99-880]|eukprot:EIE92546.1 hypothetical protein RO3G_17144 [Rhizopus delemar RA 99-880]
MSTEKYSRAIAIQIDTPKYEDFYIREMNGECTYMSYISQGKTRSFKLKIAKNLSTSAAVKQLEVHIHAA